MNQQAVQLAQHTRSRVRADRGATRGFTLIEVLLAMVLTVMLMTALMSVAAASSRDQRRLDQEESESQPAWLAPLASQIEADLLMGSAVSGPVRVAADQGGARLYLLTQHASTTPEGSQHLPVLVAYRLIDSAQGGVLLREQQPLTVSQGVTPVAAGHGAIQVMATGIDAIELGGTTLRLSQDTSQQPTTSPRQPSAFTFLIDNRPVHMLPIAPQVHLAVTLPNTSSDGEETDREQSRNYEWTLLTQ